jgi:S-adenosylmethionine:diacylglycerol 3-amino-3-carboxypropyl transferase
MEMISTSAATEWERGRFDGRSGPRKLLFGYMYEDAAIELTAFHSRRRLFCIASAGCTAMKLAANHDVVAVDLNPIQLAYVEERLAGGLLQRGSAERLMALLRALGPLAGWSRGRVRAFLELDDPREQIVYWQRHLDTKRFRAALNILFSRRTLSRVYATSFLEFLPAKFGNVLRGRMERCFARHSNRNNPYAHAMFLGEMPVEGNLPARGKIQLVQADAATFLKSQPAGSFDGFTLSNILDGANAAYEQRLFAALKRAATPGAVAVLRSLREPLSDSTTNRAADERSMLWGIVDLRPAAAL